MSATAEHNLFRALHFLMLWPVAVALLYALVAGALAVWGVDIWTPVVASDWAPWLIRIGVTSMGLGGLAKMAANVFMAEHWRIEVSEDGRRWEVQKAFRKGNLDYMRKEMRFLKGRTDRRRYMRLASDRGEVDQVLKPSAMELDE